LRSKKIGIIRFAQYSFLKEKRKKVPQKKEKRNQTILFSFYFEIKSFLYLTFTLIYILYIYGLESILMFFSLVVGPAIIYGGVFLSPFSPPFTLFGMIPT